jgi:putative ABC transport system permease protein
MGATLGDRCSSWSGWSPRGLTNQLLAEGTLLSALGVAIGLPLGLVVAEVIVAPVADTMALNFEQAVARPIIRAEPQLLALAAIAGILSGALAAWLPARRAARTPIVTLQARQRARDPWPEGRAKRYARIALPVAATIAVLLQLATGSEFLGPIVMLLAVVASGLLVQPALRLAGMPAGWLLGPTGWAGARDQSRAPSRAIAATGMLMAGLALVIWIATTGKFRT